jgi:peptidoglycan L-alanyl-D-glutamate endopeptidase CwlK
MPDWKTLNAQKLAQLHPVFAVRVSALLADMEVQGIPVLVTQGLRTWAEQDALYAQGRTKPGQIITKAPGGHSQHNFGLAVDLCPDDVCRDGLQLDWNVTHPVWRKLIELAPTHQLAAGAKWRTFPDNPHFYPVEIPATTEKLRELYTHGGLKAVWAWFDSLVSVREKAATIHA